MPLCVAPEVVCVDIQFNASTSSQAGFLPGPHWGVFLKTRATPCDVFLAGCTASPMFCGILKTNKVLSLLVVGRCWLWIDFGSELLVSVSISQYQLILWYFTANSSQLSGAVEGDVSDGINNIFLTFCSSLCSSACWNLLIMSPRSYCERWARYLKKQKQKKQRHHEVFRWWYF